MILREEQGDLFDKKITSRYALCHCISSDFAMGAGIAKTFTALGVKAQLEATYPKYWDGEGYCLFAETITGVPVANLVTKQFYNNKPTLETLRQALEDMRGQVVKLGIRRVAMPYIGCGLDRLKWPDVKTVVENTFMDTNIDILVRYI